MEDIYFMFSPDDLNGVSNLSRLFFAPFLPSVIFVEDGDLIIVEVNDLISGIFNWI